MPAAQQDPRKNLKIILAVALLIVAGVVYAMTSGLLGGSSAPTASPEVKAAAAEKLEQAKTEAAKAPSPPSGAN